MPYMQLFKLHLIHVFLQKNLANVKKWPKNGHFHAKNHVLQNSCENTSRKLLDDLPKTTPNHKPQKNR